MRNVRTKAMPVIIGVIGTISKSLRQYLNNILGRHEMKELQKTAIMVAAYVLHKILTYKYKTHLTCKITLHIPKNCKYTA